MAPKVIYEDAKKAIKDGKATRLIYVGPQSVMKKEMGIEDPLAYQIDNNIYVYGEQEILRWWSFAPSPNFVKASEYEVITDKKLFDEGLLQKALDAEALADTQILLRALADHYTSKTKIQQVLPYTMTYRVYAKRPYLKSGQELIEIPLYKFFGMYVGYNIEFDTLVYWVPEPKLK